MTQPIPNSALQIEARTRTNTHYAKAINAQPGYAEAAALRDKAKQRKRSVLFPMVQWPTQPTDLSADLDEYLTAYNTAYQEEQNRTRDAEALDAVIGACERRMRSAIDNPDTLLSVLADELDELMTQVADVVTRLNGATTPTEAINTDSVAAWRELPALRLEYDSIRHAQTLVLLDAPAINHRSDHIDDPMASDVVLANLDALIPGWREPDTRYAMQGAPPDRRPWPADPLEQLVWFITSDAKIWLPTSSDLSALHAERLARLNPLTDEQPDSPRQPKPA